MRTASVVFSLAVALFLALALVAFVPVWPTLPTFAQVCVGGAALGTLVLVAAAVAEAFDAFRCGRDAGPGA